MKLIEDHYLANRRNLVKRMSFPAGDGAEDVVQEAYYRALKYVDSYNPERGFEQWFNQILNNCLREYRNTEKGFATETFEEHDQEGIDYAVGFNQKIMQEVSDIITTKSLVQIEVLGYHIKQGYTAKEVSEITEYNYITCYQIIRRFRQELRELYEINEKA